MFKGLLSEIADSITYMNSYVKLGVGDKVLVNTYAWNLNRGDAYFFNISLYTVFTFPFR